MKATLLFLLLAASLSAETVRTSFYGEECRGKPMAWKGKPFNPDALTCASWFYPFGTKLRVSCGKRSVVVTVTDRGPAKRLLDTRQLDLSAAAFAALAPLAAGVISVHVERLPSASR
jgi:rare lipoprotein A